MSQGFTGKNLLGIATTASGAISQVFTSQTSVTVTHGLGIFPIVQVLNATGAVILPDTIVHNSINSFTVTFSESTSGIINASVGASDVTLINPMGCVFATEYGVVGTQTAISAAISAIGSDNRTLYLCPGTWSITSDLTIPANITLKPERGAILSIATTKTLTINGSFDAGLHQVFSCVGTGKVVFGAGSVKEVYPQWWGAVADGTTDDRVAIQAAIDSLLLGFVYFPNGTYIVSLNPDAPAVAGNLSAAGTAIIVKSNHKYYGSGTIKLKANAAIDSSAIFSNAGNTPSIADVVFEGLIIDGNSSNQSSGSTKCMGICLLGATRPIIKDCRIINSSYLGLTIRYGTLTDAKVVNNYIDSSRGIGIQCTGEDLLDGLIISGNSIKSTGDNAIDICANNTSGDPSLGKRTQVLWNNIYDSVTGIFMESTGEAIISDNYIQKVSHSGIRLNRINSGANRITIQNNKITNETQGASGVYTGNNIYYAYISNNFFDNLDYSITFPSSSSGSFFYVGSNYHDRIKYFLINVTNNTNCLIRSKIEKQIYASGRVSRYPKNCTPNNSFNNASGRFYQTVADNSQYNLCDGVEYYDYLKNTTTTVTNSGWGGAYAIYYESKTLVYVTSGAPAAGEYVVINGSTYKVGTPVSGNMHLLTTAGAEGNFTATVNGLYSISVYYPEWATD